MRLSLLCAHSSPVRRRQPISSSARSRPLISSALTRSRERCRERGARSCGGRRSRFSLCELRPKGRLSPTSSASAYDRCGRREDARVAPRAKAHPRCRAPPPPWGTRPRNRPQGRGARTSRLPGARFDVEAGSQRAHGVEPVPEEIEFVPRGVEACAPTDDLVIRREPRSSAMSTSRSLERSSCTGCGRCGRPVGRPYFGSGR